MRGQRIEMAGLAGESGVSYCDGRILFACGHAGLPGWIVGARPDFALTLYCRSGECAVAMDGKEYGMGTGCVFVVEEQSVVSGFSVSPDFECDIVGYKWGVLEEMPSFFDVAWPLSDFFARMPALRLSAPDAGMLGLYVRRMECVVSRQSFGHSLKAGLMEGLARCLLYEFAGIVRMISSSPEAGGAQRRRDVLQRRFLSIVAEGRGRIRSVREAADIMGVSAKHLSKVVMDTCGERALDIINDSTLRSAMRLLRDTDMPVKEVASEMGFNSASCFNQFVSRLSGGQSPSDIREEAKKQGT